MHIQYCTYRPLAFHVAPGDTLYQTGFELEIGAGPERATAPDTHTHTVRVIL